MTKPGESFGALSALQNAKKTERELKNSPLTEDHMRILEYFWNKHAHEVRKSMPFEVITFFESEKQKSDDSEQARGRTKAFLKELEIKGMLEVPTSGYVLRSIDGERYKLTVAGAAYISQRHPKALTWWSKILERTPDSLSLGVTLVGLVASVFGIIQFIAWIG